MSYRQIASDERYMISHLRRHDFTQSEIADILGRHRSSISRELRRNCSRWGGAYRPSKGNDLRQSKTSDAPVAGGHQN